MNLDVVPDLTMLGYDDPHGRTAVLRPPTVGQLAARIQALAASPGEWWHLVAFDPAAPVRVPLTDEAGVRLWLTTWPPGHRTAPHDHADTTEVTMLTAGELTEITILDEGVSERELRTNRARVHGGGHTHELHNPGPAYAITIHAHVPAGS